MNIIKYYLARLAEKITGRKCNRCAHNHAGRCCHYDRRMFASCWLSVTRPGFFRRPKPLTEEELHQLQKIKGVLQEAEDDARESGLLED